MLTTLLDLAGLGLAVGFAFLVWPPLALLAGAAACLLVSRSLVKARP